MSICPFCRRTIAVACICPAAAIPLAIDAENCPSQYGDGRALCDTSAVDLPHIEVPGRAPPVPASPVVVASNNSGGSGGGFGGFVSLSGHSLIGRGGGFAVT
jgi:hypothetical protein